MNAVTRPSIKEWSKKDNLIQLESWRRNGLTIEDIAKNIGISKQTIYNWMKKSVDFLEALKSGQDYADNIIENALFEKAKNGDTTAMIFWLKNRRPKRWRDKQHNEINLTQDFEIEVDEETED